MADKEEVKSMFDNVQNLRITDLVAEEFRSDEKLVSLLDFHELGFLAPFLKIQQDMEKQISSPENLLKWIHDNVPKKYHKQSGFISALLHVVLKHIYDVSSVNQGKTYNNFITSSFPTQKYYF